MLNFSKQKYRRYVGFQISRNRKGGFGPTPLSSGREIRLAHPSTVWADALDDLAAFADIRTGCEVEVDLETDLKHSPVKTASGQ